MGGEWKTAPLSELARITNGKRPKVISKSRSPNCKVPVYGGGGLSGYTTDAMYHAGTLVTGRVGTLGKLFAPRDDFWPTDNTIVIVPQSPQVDNAFLRYSLEPAIPFLASVNRGVANPLITQKDVQQLVVHLPPLQEQRAIAHILGTLDDKIELNRRMNETLEAMARALFKSWFVDFDPVVVNAIKAGNPIPEKFAKRAAHYRQNPDALRFPEHILRLFPDRFVDSELGPIPEGWEVKAIGEVVKCVGGGTPSTKKREYWEGGTIPFLTPRDMAALNAPIVLDTERHITDAGIEQISSGKLPVGTVLLSSRAPIGYLAISKVPLSINQGIIAMICEGAIPNFYVYFWAKENMGVIKAKAGGTTFPEISKKAFRTIPMLVLAGAPLKEFAHIAGPYFTLIASHTETANILAAMRDKLLPKLVSGKLRVPDVEKIVGDHL